MRLFITIAFTIACASANASTGTIFGNVTTTTGQPVITGSVRVTANGILGPLTPIDDTGAYSATVIFSGGSAVCAIQTISTGLLDQSVGNILLDANGIVLQNFVLTSGDTISGVVTDSTTGLPISIGSVLVFGSAGTMLGSASTDNAGAYNYGGLVDGTYYARADAPGYVDDLWNSVSCPHGNCALSLGTPIVVPTSGTTNSIANFQLIRDLDYIFSNDFEAAL